MSEIYELKIECGSVETDDSKSNWGTEATLKQVDTEKLLEAIPEEDFVDYVENEILPFDLDMLLHIVDNYYGMFDVIDIYPHDSVINTLIDLMGIEDFKKAVMYKLEEQGGIDDKLLIFIHLHGDKYLIAPLKCYSKEDLKGFIDKSWYIFLVYGELILEKGEEQTQVISLFPEENIQDAFVKYVKSIYKKVTVVEELDRVAYVENDAIEVVDTKNCEEFK